MKKIVYISFFALIAASCQKEQITPSYASPSSLEKDVNDDGTTFGGSLTNNGASTGGTDHGTDGDVNDGTDITDPMRKKDKKDNK